MGNVFAQNLHSVVYQAVGTTFIDNTTFARLADLGWKRCEGNQQLLPDIPLDPRWFDVYVNRTAYVPGKVVMDEWNQLRHLLGQPTISTGGRATASRRRSTASWRSACGRATRSAALAPAAANCR